MTSPIDVDALPLPGTQLFLPFLLSQLRSTAPGLPLEPVIIQVLLLSIISGDRNLIIRTRDEDVNFVSKLTSLALSTVFGYNVHKLRCHSDTAKQTPSEFIRSLFFSLSTITPPTDGLSGSSHKHRHRRMSSSRTSNSGSRLPVVPPARSRRTSFSRSISYPTDSKPSISTLRRAQFDSEEPVGVEADLKPVSNTEAYSRRPSILPTSVQTATSVVTPTPSVKTHPGYASHGSGEPLKLPSAVVVSALEHASTPAQKAVLRTLSERKIIMSDEGTFGHDQEGLTLELPEGFFMVYVCPSDPRERPPIHKSLLDKFAMSSTVNLSPQTRLAMRQYRPSSSASTALSSPHTSATSAAFPTLQSLNSLPGPPTPPPPPLATPLIPSALLHRLKQLCATQTRIRPPLNIYLADLFSAARHYGPLDGMMLTTRARQDAEALVRATRVLGVDHTGSELIKERAHRTSDIDSTGSTYPHSHPSMGGASSNVLIETFDILEPYEPSTTSSAHRSFANQSQSEEPVELDVSEADIARIFPRVVSHRVRIRDSPYDEVLSSAICGAISTPGDELRGEEVGEQWERETVKDILVHILAEV